MNKKAFTLAELIGIVTILAVIAVLAVPIIDKTLKENKNNLYKVQIDNMLTGLKNWATDNASSLPEDSGEIVTLTLAQLKQGAYVDIEITNPKTKKLFPNDMLLTITAASGGYIFEVDESSGTTEGENYNPYAPIITFKGNALERVNLNETYTDPGVTAKTVNGEEITDIIKVITENGVTTSSISTVAKTKYIITYSVTDNNVTTKIERTVIVEDTTPPVLTVPSSTTLLISEVASFNVMEGVSATDNSGETIKVTSSSNLSAILGTYTVIYTAKDSSGNIVTKKRIIIVGNKPLYADDSGASVPDLYDALIPIKYSQNSWVVADLTEKWYDYNAKEWANAILVDSSVRSSYIPGKTVVENDVLGYYVWIPRYSYQLWNAANGNSVPFSIDISFQNINDPVATGSSNGERLTHPAFWWDDNNNGVRERNEEKKGVWIAKYEASAPSNSTCYTAENTTNCNITTILPRSKPNVKSWRLISVSTAFTVSRNMQNAGNIYGLPTTGIDTHMIKNSEWGAVAYLSHSKYGQVKAIGKNDNTSNITGCGTSNLASGGTATCNQYNTSEGVTASTTGNVYGVYDMSGGTHEYVMANELTSGGIFTIGSSGFGSAPAIKYYDNYAYNGSTTDHSRGKLGDATKEILATYGNSAGSWYGQASQFIYGGLAYFFRGGYSYENPIGLFHYRPIGGEANGTVTFRMAIN